jgi:hypothetical protein
MAYLESGTVRGTAAVPVARPSSYETRNGSTVSSVWPSPARCGFDSRGVRPGLLAASTQKTTGEGGAVVAVSQIACLGFTGKL